MKYVARSRTQILVLVALSALAAAQNIVSNPSVSQKIAQPAGTEFSVNRFEAIRYADQFPGSDIGAQVNYAYTNDCPASGCIIIIPAGTWSYNTPIFCTTSSKPCLIEGAPGGAVSLVYSPTDGVHCTGIILDWGAGHQAAGGIRDLSLTVNGTCPIHGAVTTAVALGPTHSLDQAILSGLNVSGANIGVDFQNAFNITIRNSVISGCSIGVNFDSVASEEDRIVDSAIIQNGTGISITVGAVDLYLITDTLDDNTTNAISVTGGTATSSFIHDFGSHYENAFYGGTYPTANYVNFSTGQSGRFVKTGGLFQDDAPASGYGTTPEFVSFVGHSIELDSVNLYTVGRTVTQVVNATGSYVYGGSYMHVMNLSPGTIGPDCTGCSGMHYLDIPMVLGSTPTITSYNYNWQINGHLSKSSGSFRIDHPIDPANKYLSHSFVESPDMMNIYNGIATLDQRGEARITLPSYFEALNKDFRYQLSSIGRSQPGLYVADEIHRCQFRIAGGKPDGKVSWQVTGIRRDAYANAHRVPVEESKEGAERGHYLHPELFSSPNHDMIEDSQERTGVDTMEVK
jgi:hypothetical protein